jgi:hypothetical protein
MPRLSKEGQVLSQRNTHYWLWFLLLGVVSALVSVSQGKGITTETLWLLITGFLGLVLDMILPALARPFDLVIGLLFTVVGLLGILHNFGLNLVATSGIAPNAIDETAILGLSLSLPYALIHTVLGLTSLSHGLRARVATSRVAVATPTAVEEQAPDEAVWELIRARTWKDYGNSVFHPMADVGMLRSVDRRGGDAGDCPIFHCHPCRAGTYGCVTIDKDVDAARRRGDRWLRVSDVSREGAVGSAPFLRPDRQRARTPLDVFPTLTPACLRYALE